MKVLITGGSGLVGMALTKRLTSLNIPVIHLTRQKNSKAGVKTYVWDYKRNYLEDGALNEVTHIIHLAGAGIAEKPWTMGRKREIVKSRVLTARLLLNKAKEKNIQLEKFISASAIGYYGAITTEQILTEESECGNDFVAECCIQWERQAQQFSEICPVAIVRTGIILAKGEGALGKIESSLKRGLGAPIGSGKQYMPWVHLDDLVNMYVKLILDKHITGIYNAVASDHTNNKDFTYCLASAMNKKIRLPNVPAFMMKLIFGEMAEILLEGTRISNEKSVSHGFIYQHTNLDVSLKEMYQ